mmetsp:Transcript_13934/g.22165  ORF Transcript_13934/g.22165 Transcript_13934/m.22165 type:complete len:1058 (-) Transcript_13934:274-3447(-)
MHGPARDHFLVWREGLTSAEGLPSKVQLKESEQRSAIWSDRARLGSTDGFDLLSWRDECTSDLQSPPIVKRSSRNSLKLEASLQQKFGELDKVEPSRARVQLAKPTKPTKPATLAVPLRVECPASLVQALEALQARGAAVDKHVAMGMSPILPPPELAQKGQPSKRAMASRRIWIGERTIRKLGTKPSDLALLAVTSFGGAKFVKPHEVEEEIEEAMVGAASFPVEVVQVCRGYMPQILEDIARHNQELAQWRKQCREEASTDGRKLAVAWRRRASLEMTGANGQNGERGVGRGRAAMSETSQTEEMDARLQAVLTRLRSQSAVISQETEPLVGSETDGINKMATSTCSPLKKRVRDFINGNIAEQKKHVRRMMHKRTQRKECFKALPLAEQVAVAEAFNLHKEADGTISLKGSLLAMRELGLRGNSMMERAAVERAVTEMTLLLMDVEEKGLLATVSSTGNKCSWWRTLAEPDLAEELEFLQRKLQMRALSKRPSASSTSPTSPSSPTSPRFPSSPTAARALTFKRKRIPISPNSSTQAKVHIQKMQELMAEAQEGHVSATAAPLRDPSARPSGLPIEAFGAEILPFARLELYDIRTEPHFRQFVEDLDNGHFSHGISVAQFRNIMLSLKFDQFEGDPEIQQFLEFAAASEQRLDFETLHSKLLRLEELAGRAASTREREVAAASNMTMAFFHQHRAEFLWMFTIFQQYDADRSGYLIHSEAKRLLKHIGLEPYNPVSAAMIDGLLKEIDQDGNFEVDFREFLLLVNLARSHLQKRRKRHLLGAWKELDVDRYGRLSMHLLVPGLASAGLLNSRAEYALAQSFMDESWDLSSFFFEDDLLPSQKRIMRSRDDAGSIYFAGFSLFYQQVAERLACIQGERIMSSAKSMGFTMEALSEIQETFDTLDTDGSGSLNKDELQQALNPLLMIPPSPDDVDEILNLIDNDSNGLVDIREFLCLLRLLVTPGGGLAKRVKPFTIRHDVPVLSQREILKMFRISESYVNECEPADVLEMCCNFLTLGADYDLKQLPKPVSNGRQLRDLAAAQADRKREYSFRKK